MDIDPEIGEPIVKKIKSVASPEDSRVPYDYKDQTRDISEVPNVKDNLDLDRKDDGVLENDDDSFQFPPDDDVSDMLEGVEYQGSFPTITDRYFTAYYKLNVQCPADDIRILVHSNRICMLSLAPSHVALQAGKQVSKVDFKVSDKLDRTLNKVSGKSKHGAQPLQNNSNICMISCSNGETYTIKCCMIGKLVEVNEALLEDPKLLLQPPHKGGYLAIVLPNIKLLEKMKETLLTEEQYKSAIIERENAVVSKGSRNHDDAESSEIGVRSKDDLKVTEGTTNSSEVSLSVQS